MSLSASQVLAIQPIPPPTLPTPFRAAHESPCDKRNYAPFLATSTGIPSIVIDRFRAYINSMRTDFSTVSFTLPSPLPGLLLCNESDVRQFLDSQILIPVWPVILSMLPDPPIRDYDWFLCNDRASSVSDDDISLPDKVFLRLSRRFDASGQSILLSDSAVIIEVKAPGLVSRSKSIFDSENLFTDNWATMTSQLRKYAHIHNCRHVVLMDECTAFYFTLKKFTEDSDSLEYLVASSQPISNVTGTNPLTVREIVAFSAWNSLNDSRNPRLKNYNSSIPESDLQAFSYQPLYGTPSLPTALNASNSPRRRQQSRYKPQDLKPEPTLRTVDIDLHICYRISLDYNDYDHDDIGSRYSTMFLPYKDIYPKVKNSDGPTLYLDIYQGIGEDLFLVLSAFEKDGLFVLKRFRGQRCYLQYELEAYNALSGLQGSIIPNCYGVYTKATHSTIVSGLDYVLDDDGGDDVDALFLLLKYDHRTPLSSHNLTTKELDVAESKALLALQELHNRKVFHNDLNVENILISASGVVTIVGFGLSLCNPDEFKLVGRELADRASLRKAFLQASKKSR